MNSQPRPSPPGAAPESKTRNPPDEPDCECCSLNPKDEPLDCVSVGALVILTIGIVLVSVGYLVPRDHVLDHDRPARENEALGLYYADLAAKLDICIIAGMICVGLGGMTMAVLLLIILCRGELNDIYNSRAQPYYGTADSTRLIQMSEMGPIIGDR